MSLFISLNHLCNSMSSNLCLIMLTIPTSEKCAFSKRFPKPIRYKELTFIRYKVFLVLMHFIVDLAILKGISRRKNCKTF